MEKLHSLTKIRANTNDTSLGKHKSINISSKSTQAQNQLPILISSESTLGDHQILTVKIQNVRSFERKFINQLIQKLRKSQVKCGTGV